MSQSFVYRQLNVKTVVLHAIQFSTSTPFNSENSSISNESDFCLSTTKRKNSGITCNSV